MPIYKFKRKRVEPENLVWLRARPGTLTRLHAEATVGLDKIESEARDLIGPARAGDPIAQHLLAARFRGTVASAAECAAETKRRRERTNHGP